MARYICHMDTIPTVVVDAIGSVRRITAGIYADVPEPIGDAVELLTKLALVDAPHAAHLATNFVEILLERVTQDPHALSRFYKLYYDYIEMSAKIESPRVLKMLALAHFFGITPQEAVPVLKTLIKKTVELGDCKSAELAYLSLATIAPEEVSQAPRCIAKLELSLSRHDY